MNIIHAKPSTDNDNKANYLCLDLIDVCLPDYFRGFDGEYFVVPVDGTMTAKDVIQALQQEINTQAMQEDINYDLLVSRLRSQMVQSLGQDRFRNEITFPDVPRDAEDVFAYFGVCIDE